MWWMSTAPLRVQKTEITVKRLFIRRIRRAALCILIELRYTKYIENRYFGEEEPTLRDEMLFQAAKQKLKEVFMELPYWRHTK